MGNKLSTVNVIAPEPVPEVIIHTGNCFICLEPCEQLYSTRCDCIVYCHARCDRRYRGWVATRPRVNIMHNCPMCRSAVYNNNNDNDNDNDVTEMGFVTSCCLGLLAKFIQLVVILFITIIVPFVVGFVAVFILDFDNISEGDTASSISRDWVSIWILGFLVIIVLMSAYMIGKSCLYCYRSEE